MPDVSNNTATYQAPVTVNRQYATLYLLLNGMTPMTDIMVVDILKNFLKTDFDTSSLPHIYTRIVPTEPYIDPYADPTDDITATSRITSGPWMHKATGNGNRLVAIKWVLKYLGGNEVPSNVLQNFKTTYNTKIKPLISKNINMDTLDFAFEPYGTPLRGDKGFPLTPPTYTVAPRNRIITPDTTPKPEPISFREVKKDNTALLWFLGIVGGLYSLKRML